jgi:hypothetical protein
MSRVILTYFRVFVLVCGLGVEWGRIRGLEVGQFARIQWFGLSTRALATVLEPDLAYRVSLTRGIDVVGLRYLNFLLAQGNAAHNIHTSSLVGLGVLCIGILEDLLVIGTISRLAGFRDLSSHRVFLPRPSSLLASQRLIVDIRRAIVGQSISRVDQKRITIGRRLQH